MNIPSLKPVISALAKLLVLPSLALLMLGCGGGGGGSDDVETQPAPQTLNALTLSLYSGFDITFIRDSGDTLNGVVETGSIIVGEEPAASTEGDFVDRVTELTTVQPSSRVWLGTYTYDRTSSESGVITLTGSSADDGDYFKDGFERTYAVDSFASNGATITAMTISDYGEELVAPGLLWSNPSIRLFNGGAVPVGYSVATSEGQTLPYLFPNTSFSNDRLRMTPDVGSASTDVLEYVLQNSTTSQFFNSGNTLADDTGSGSAQNLDNPTDPVTITIGYEYTSNQLTIDKAVIVINGPAPYSNITYNLTFGDYKSGTYNINGSTTDIGEFEFLDF